MPIETKKLVVKITQGVRPLWYHRYIGKTVVVWECTNLFMIPEDDNHKYGLPKTGAYSINKEDCEVLGDAESEVKEIKEKALDCLDKLYNHTLEHPVSVNLPDYKITESTERLRCECHGLLECPSTTGSIKVVKGVKHDKKKLRWCLLPMAPLRYVVAVLTHGAVKYEDNNWQKVSNGKERYYSAMIRHIDQHVDGEWIDDEFGLPHLAHALCCLIFLFWLELNERNLLKNKLSQLN